MQIVETNITELSKMLSKEYEGYENRITQLENALISIKIATQAIQKQPAINAFTNFECNQILSAISEVI